MNRLSSEVVSALRTDVTITSAPQCVTELVLNSIDAKATSIAVRVDLNLLKIQVIDNGCGISQDDLSLLGHRYVTSKCHSLHDLQSSLSSFGFRGEALASLCEVAGTILITSRPSGSDNTFCKMITRGRHQKVFRSSRPRPAQGTTILVGDFLYNRPVRRARVKCAFDLEEIKTLLEYIALIHPQVSLSLRDDSNGQMILETRRSNSVVDTFSSLFGPTIAETLCPVKESAEPFEVAGYISKEAYAHKNLQFIYVNKRLVLKSKLHKLVNSIMGRSSILKINNVPQNPISKELNSAFFLAMSPPKRAKNAVYILNVTCPYSEYDITLEPKKTLIEFRDWDTILNCIEKLLRNFLEPQVTPDSPVHGNSVLDEINQLAREDCSAKGGGLSANLGIRSILGLPARRDTVTYTPPSQYSQESTIVSSESEKESLAPLTCYSEDPFPSHLRGKAPPSASSENPFGTERPTNRNHDFDTTSQEGTIVSTKDFFTMFKQPVFHKKLKHPKPQTKLPVGNPLIFDLNLQRITNIFRPARFTNDEAAARRKRSIFNSLQKFSNEKSAQGSPASTDTAKYHTPLNAPTLNQTESNSVVDSLADLPFVSDLEARPGTLSDCESAVQTSSPIDDSGIVVDQNPETNLRKNFETGHVTGVRERPERRAQGSVLETADSQLPTSDKVVRIDRDQTSERKNQVENVPRPVKGFISSEDFLVTREDMSISGVEDFGNAGSSQADSESLLNDRNIQGDSLSALVELLRTDSDYEGSSQSPSSDIRVPVPLRQCSIVHHKSSGEFGGLKTQQSTFGSPNVSSDPEELATVGSGLSLNVKQMKNSSVLPFSTNDPYFVGFPSEQSCEDNLQSSPGSSTVSNLLLESSETSPVKSNPRKRNVENDGIDDIGGPLKKVISFDKGGDRNCEGLCAANVEDLCTAPVETFVNTPRETESYSNSMTDLSEKSQSMNFESPNSFPSSGWLKRRSVVLNCSIADLFAVLSPRQNRILNKVTEEIEVASDSNEIEEAVVHMEVETSRISEKGLNETSRFLAEEITNKGIDTAEKSENIETEEETQEQFRKTGEFNFFSSCDTSLLAVYEGAMSYVSDRKSATLEESEASTEKGRQRGESTTELQHTNPRESDTVWEELTDNSGRKYFVHSLNGTIRFEQDSAQTFRMESRCKFLPKGLSPMVGNTMSSQSTQLNNSTSKDSKLTSFIDETELAVAKWPNGKPEGAVEKPWRFVDQLLTTFESEKEVSVTSAIIQDQSVSQIKVYNVCYPYTFNKDIFNNLRVLGQLDRKFIVTIAKIPSSTEPSEVVILFDQHAVHERIRVELLTKEYREANVGVVWRSAPVHPALPLSLSAREVRVMTNCSDKLRALGLRFSKTDSHSVRITGVPTCLLLREDREVHGRGASVLKSHLESLIREEVDALVQTRGAGVEQPAIIRNVIASEACGGAVKFGHPLEKEDCRAILHNLSTCNVPFQCAHGRPALTPIADLSHLPKPLKPRKPNLRKLQKTRYHL